MADLDGMDEAARAAYAAAQELIAETIETGEAKISFNLEVFRALTHIPPEIDYIEGLIELDLKKTMVSDLSPTRDLTGLQKLNLSQTDVNDLSPISGLTQLKILDLDQTKVVDLSPISGFAELGMLSFDRTGVSDLSAIHGLIELNYLSLAETDVHDLSPLRDLILLLSLRIDRSQVVDLSIIAKLSGLQALSISQLPVSDLSPINGLSLLQYLYLSDTSIKDLSPIRELTKLKSLWLNRTRVNDLSPIQSLISLKTLSLMQTEVSNLAPIQKLTGLDTLWLTGTEVTDLRPLIEMEELGSGADGGLWFSHTPAVREDHNLARLDLIADNQQRAKETLAYLKTLPPWPEPLPWLAKGGGEIKPPEQDPALPLIWGEKGFSFLANSIDSDPVTEAALEDLRDLLEDLRRKGNRHDDLYRLAGELQDRTKGEVRDLNLVKLHLSYQKLQRLYRSRDQRIEKFDDETVGTLDSVLGILPGVTMADPGVAELIERQEKDRLAGSLPETKQAEEGVLLAVQDKDAPFDDDVKDTAKSVLEPGQNDRHAATRSVMARNTVIVVFKYVGSAMVGGAIGGPVGNFVYEHGLELLSAARTMGDDAFFWAQMVFANFKADYQIAMGIANEAMGSGKLAAPKRSKAKDHLPQNQKPPLA
jgi:internalin A